MLKTLLRHSYKTKQNTRLKDLSEASEALYKKKNPFVPYQLINDLIREIDIPLDSGMFWFVSKKIKGGISSALKQLLLTTSPHLIQQSILHTHEPSKPLSFYLPKVFLRALKQKGVNVNFQESRIFFVKSVLGKYFESFKVLGALIRNRDNFSMEKSDNFCSIHGGPDGILPQKGTNTFLNWLEGSERVQENIYSSYRFVANQTHTSNIQFDKSIHISPHTFPSLTLKNKMIFVLQSFCFLLISSVFFLGARWQLAFLSKEILYYFYFKNLTASQKAKCYIFFCHDLGFRPLWTYQAEKEEREVILAFYASSYTLFTYNGVSLSKDLKLPYVQVASWSHYWVQSADFKDTLSELLEVTAKVEVVGAFPFTDRGVEVPILKKNEVLVFDVDPSDDYLEYTKHGYILPNFTNEVVLKFWKDLYQVAKSLNLCLVHKRKRSDPLEAGDYVDLLLTFQKDPSTYRIIPENINTYELIKKNKNFLSVSLPFTSTGELSALLGAKGIYYNPMETVQSEKTHAGEVSVITKPDNLKEWLLRGTNERKR